MTNAAAANTRPVLTQCPICDEPGLKRTVNKVPIEDCFGGKIEIEKVYYRCDQCGAEGDWNQENEAPFLAALEQLRKMAAANIADALKADHGVSNLQLERSQGGGNLRMGHHAHYPAKEV